VKSGIEEKARDTEAQRRAERAARYAIANPAATDSRQKDREALCVILKAYYRI